MQHCAILLLKTISFTPRQDYYYQKGNPLHYSPTFRNKICTNNYSIPFVCDIVQRVGSSLNRPLSVLTLCHYIFDIGSIPSIT